MTTLFQFSPCALISKVPFGTVSSSSRISSVDELADFAIDTLRCSSLDSDNASIYRETEAVEAKKQQFGADDLSPLFGGSELGDLFSPSSIIGYSLIFLRHVSCSTVDPSHGEFEEFPGESDKRRMARWEREQRIKNQVVCIFFDSLGATFTSLFSLNNIYYDLISRLIAGKRNISMSLLFLMSLLGSACTSNLQHVSFL